MNRVIDHFLYPRNCGELTDPDGIGIERDNPWLITIVIAIKVEQKRIKDIRFKTRGCVTAIASGSALTEMVRGKSVEEARAVSSADLPQALGYVPEEKLHCWRLAVQALHRAIQDYESRASICSSLPNYQLKGHSELPCQRY
jgi:nitrogen fixation protein NifU and related proteins